MAEMSILGAHASTIETAPKGNVQMSPSVTRRTRKGDVVRIRRDPPPEATGSYSYTKFCTVPRLPFRSLRLTGDTTTTVLRHFHTEEVLHLARDSIEAILALPDDFIGGNAVGDDHDCEEGVGRDVVAFLLDEAR
jgi:hypothetical protein